MPLPDDNPFAAPSALAYALPPFELIREEHYLPAFEEGMAQQRREIDAIAASQAPPTLENTLEAMEASGELLGRVSAVFFNLIGSSVTDGLRAVEGKVMPELAAHGDAILMDPRLFSRISSLHSQLDSSALDSSTLDSSSALDSSALDSSALDSSALGEERRRLVERYHLDMVRAGAGLSPEHQARLREINTELSTLGTAFRNQLLSDTNDLAVLVSSREELEGLPDDAIEAASVAASARDQVGYLLTLVLPTRQPALAGLRNRSLRERLYTASVSRGRRGNENDNRATVARVVTLRAERAALLGYPNHAAYIVEDQTAGSVDAVMTLLHSMVAPTVVNAAAEQAELTALLHEDGFTGDLEPWDWVYYAEILAQKRFSRDAAALRPWFELERVVHDGVFAAAQGLYGLTFHLRKDLPGYHPDVQVYEVRDESDSGIGLFVADWYARDSKRGGAWMSSFVDQSALLEKQPVVVINLNIPRPPVGSPTLLTLDEVRTAFHEFGHVLHGLLSDVRYPRLSGTSVPRDFVEYPSQVNEMWAWQPELLARYAVHHVTGEPLSDQVIASVLASQSADQGFATAEILAAMLLDQAWHQRDTSSEPVDDVNAFEAAALEKAGLALPAIPPRYASSYFAHIFAGGYSAGYYSYLWSEVLDADTEEWFLAQGGLLRSSGEVFRRNLLSRGGSVDPMAAFEAVLGRPPRVEPLLARRGLTVPD